MWLTVALGDHLGQAVEDVGKGRVLHIAHSGGALLTYLAAQHHLSKRYVKLFNINAFFLPERSRMCDMYGERKVALLVGPVLLLGISKNDCLAAIQSTGQDRCAYLRWRQEHHAKVLQRARR